jgi:hypothetical protein
MKNQGEMEQLASTLSQSIQHYVCFLDFLREMDDEMGTATPVALHNFNLSFQEMHQQAVQFDQSIAAQLNAESLKNESILILAGKRELLLKEILLLNKRITAKASGVKSLIAHEMGKLRTGLSALSGYRQPQYNQGRITDCTS